jgi:hypothetical protein
MKNNNATFGATKNTSAAITTTSIYPDKNRPSLFKVATFFILLTIDRSLDPCKMPSVKIKKNAMLYCTLSAI